MLRLLLLLLFSVILCNVESANILGIFHFPSRSHHVLGSALLKSLAARGHHVTMLSPFPLTTSVNNYEAIELTGILSYKEESMLQKTLETKNASVFDKLTAAVYHVSTINELVLNHTAVNNLIKSGRKFDLIIQCSVWNEAFLGLAYQMEASTIIFSTLGSSMLTNGITNNPAPYSYVPNVFFGFPKEMSFLQRMANTLGCIAFEFIQNLYIAPIQERLLQKYFPNAPSLDELLQNVSLVLLNSHFSIESPRPYVPNMIQIGGFHLEDPKELTGELRAFMDSAKEGVIFFSLGTNVRSSDLSDDKLKAIINSFSKISVKVLWKFERNDLPNLPSNVKISKWLPQRDILAHKNLKLFITHGGLSSTTEAVYHGVPMIAIPFVGDQESNVAEGVNRGYVIRISLDELIDETFTRAINEVLNNPSYYKNIQRHSKILKDQPLKPMDSAIYWIEYVLRHKGAHHLKTSAFKLKWYQYYLLDVVLFLVSVVLSIILATWFILSKLFRLISGIFINNSKIKLA